MTRVGTDISLGRARGMWGEGPEILQTLHAQGLEGVNIRSLTELSPGLDRGEMDDFRATAEELGMYVEMGIGKINPYMTAELPEIRALGEGDFLGGMESLIAASSAMGWRTLWTACGGVKDHPAPFDTDRARTDAPWPDQLTAIRGLVTRLVPILREHGCTLAIETHEEITTFELTALVEEIDDPHVGICLDPANPVARGEMPSDALERVAPHVVSTQLRDVVIVEDAEGTGIVRYLRPCGEGQIDWKVLLAEVLRVRPEINLTIEGVGGMPGRMDVPFDRPDWRRLHPDFAVADRRGLLRLAADARERITAGTLPPRSELDAIASDHRAHHDEFVAASAVHLRSILSELVSSDDTTH